MPAAMYRACRPHSCQHSSPQREASTTASSQPAGLLPQRLQAPTWMDPVASTSLKKASLPMMRRDMTRPATATLAPSATAPSARSACSACSSAALWVRGKV